MAASVILLEFNELSPGLMENFIGKGLLPGFKRLRDESLSAVTDAEEEGEALEPWVQWTTVHTGVPFSKHKVLKLGDGPDYSGPRIWDRVSEAGKSVWVCGSMNAAVHALPLNGYVIPDPWASNIEPYPGDTFSSYYTFVRKYVQGYASDEPPVTKAETLRFARFMVANGLSVKTVADTLRQLGGEVGGLPKWRRAPILDRLQWDVFRHNWKKLKPTLATFFINSTAHYQHYYWRDMEPELFSHQPTESHLVDHKDAILFGYRKMDEIVQEALALAGPDTTVILATALSQQPMLKYEREGGKQVFKPLSPEALMKLAGVERSHRYVPVMAEEFQLHFDNESDAVEAEQRLTSLRLGTGASAMRVERSEARLYCGCAIFTDPGAGATLSSSQGAAPARFHDIFFPLEGVKSGMHHPDGLLWIRTPAHRREQLTRRVSLEEIAPTVMRLCGLSAEGFGRPPLPELEAPPHAQAA